MTGAVRSCKLRGRPGMQPIEIEAGTLNRIWLLFFFGGNANEKIVFVLGVPQWVRMGFLSCPIDFHASVRSISPL